MISFKLNEKAKIILSNFSFTAISNIISLFISTFVILFVPKLIGVEEYSYWQLYLFYTSYVGFLHFGWNDGIYLRYGGNKYKDLNKNLFFSQFYMLLMLQVIIAITMFWVIGQSHINVNRIFILQMTTVCLLIINMRIMLLLILQSTNRIKEYAKNTILDRVIYVILIIIFVFFGFNDFKSLIIADLSGKLISLAYAIYCCRDIVCRRIADFYFSFSEAISNISAGVKLMISNVASLLIIGVVRFGIERSWDVATFGKISLTLSISNLMMAFINAVGVVIFPVLRRTDAKNLSRIYKTMRDFLMVIMFGILLFYHPIRLFLFNWLPQYSNSLIYMALLFPMSIYEGKMAILINTYLKTLRKEREMLRINIYSLILSVIVTIFTTIVLKDLDLAILSIILLLMFRSIVAEVFLSKILKVSLLKDILLEVGMTVGFVLTSWYLNIGISFFLYLVLYGMYFLFKRNDIVFSVNHIKELVK